MSWFNLHTHLHFRDTLIKNKPPENKGILFMKTHLACIWEERSKEQDWELKDFSAKVAPRDILHPLLSWRIWVKKFKINHNQIGATAGKKQAVRMLDKQNPGLGAVPLSSRVHPISVIKGWLESSDRQGSYRYAIQSSSTVSQTRLSFHFQMNTQR